jgi:hypothetical protein
VACSSVYFGVSTPREDDRLPSDGSEEEVRIAREIRPPAAGGSEREREREGVGGGRKSKLDRGQAPGLLIVINRPCGRSRTDPRRRIDVRPRNESRTLHHCQTTAKEVRVRETYMETTCLMGYARGWNSSVN